MKGPAVTRGPPSRRPGIEQHVVTPLVPTPSGPVGISRNTTGIAGNTTGITPSCASSGGVCNHQLQEEVNPPFGRNITSLCLCGRVAVCVCACVCVEAFSFKVYANVSLLAMYVSKRKKVNMYVYINIDR